MDCAGHAARAEATVRVGPHHPAPATHGWTNWWFTHQTAVGASHVGWAIALTVFVLFAPDRWLGVETSDCSLSVPGQTL